MLEFRGLCAGYGKTDVLHEIDLTAEEGTVTAIIGPNGSGKSTLVQCVNGQVPVRSGEILLDGRSLLSLEGKKRARLVAVLPQIRAVPSLSGKTLVEHGRFPYQGFARRKNREDEQKVQEAMCFTQTEPYQNVNVEELSGGERQRVFFAMVLAQDSRIVLLDEPATFLDVEYQARLMRQIRRLKELGKTVILIAHDLSQALDAADKIAVLNRGRIVFSGGPEECLESGVLQEVFCVSCRVFTENGRRFVFFE